ncbi:MAG: hypothetical protein BroJett030_32260 [Alphaproteobacteria bacterium]|nr:MAG: hypothetical protein BroJett030_32260 [Alphaproteobacteria bacterium]
MNRDILALRETKFAGAALERVRLDGTFRGYAAIFGERDLGNDVVLPGAFAASLARRGPENVRMLFQHDPDEPIGTWTSIVEDGRGLYVTGRLATAVARGREVLELMRAGAIDGLSIGFRTIRARADRASRARHIVEADLWEISVVTFPMQLGARVDQVKAARRPSDPGLPTIRQFERWLMQDAGLTRGQARAVITRGFAHLAGMRDAAAATPRELAGRIRLAARAIANLAEPRNTP